MQDRNLAAQRSVMLAGKVHRILNLPLTDYPLVICAEKALVLN